MHILIVGAGSVGLSYGTTLSQGGARVDYLIKPHHRSSLLGDLKLHHLKSGFSRSVSRALTLRETQLLDHPTLVAGVSYDHVLFTLPSTALSDNFLSQLTPVLDPRAHLINLSPGVGDRGRIQAHFPTHPLSSGFITLVAFQTPLPEAEFSPGVAMWQPPLSSLPFHGSRELLTPFIDALNRGGLRAMYGGEKAPEGALASAILMPLVSALASAGYEFGKLRKSPQLALAKAASREALTILAKHQRTTAPPLLKLLSRVSWPVLLRVSQWVVPFPLESYLRFHFEKVRPQTIAALDEICLLAKANNLPHKSLERLRDEVFA